MSTPTVFISYSHVDEVWKLRLLPHLQALERAGVPMTVWHDRVTGTVQEFAALVEDVKGHALALNRLPKAP